MKLGRWRLGLAVALVAALVGCGAATVPDESTPGPGATDITMAGAPSSATPDRRDAATADALPDATASVTVRDTGPADAGTQPVPDAGVSVSLDAGPASTFDASTGTDAGDVSPPEPSCDLDNGGCDPLTACSADAGAITCGACPQGYTGDGDIGCSDIDECAVDGGPCGPFDTCENLAGAPPVCTDIDECAVGNGGCDLLSTCTDRVADTPLCGACPEHYEGDGYVGCELASGRVRWVERVADPIDSYSDQYAFAVAGAADGSGFAAAGRFVIDTIFAPGRSWQRTFTAGPYDSAGSLNDTNGWVAWYNASGRLAWVARTHDYRNSTDPVAVAAFTGVTVLSDRSVVAVGYHGAGSSNSVTTILGLGEANETTLVSTMQPGGPPEIMVARYHPDGRLAWARGGDSFDYGRAYRVATLQDDSVVVVGAFTTTTTLGQGEANETTLTATAQVEGFVARYAADGSLMWARQTTGDCYTLLYAVAALPDDQGVVVGGRRGLGPPGGCEVLLDEGEATEQRLGNFNMYNRVATYEPFIARLDLDGNAVWIEGMRTESNHVYELSTHALAADSSGDIYVTGSYAFPMYFAEGTPQEVRLDGGGGSFLARYDIDGVLKWARHVGGFTSDIGTNLAVDDADRPIMTGEITGTQVFGLGEAEQTELTVPECYIESYTAGGYVATYEASGTLRWARGWPCSSPRAIAAIAGGPLICVGSFWHETTFGAGEPGETTIDDQYFSTERDGMLVGFQP